MGLVYHKLPHITTVHAVFSAVLLVPPPPVICRLHLMLPLFAPVVPDADENKRDHYKYARCKNHAQLIGCMPAAVANQQISPAEMNEQIKIVKTFHDTSSLGSGEAG